MEECLRRFRSPAAHEVSCAVGVDLGCLDSNSAAIDVNPAALKRTTWLRQRGCVVTKVGNSSEAMEEGLRRFKSPVASPTAKQGKCKSATTHGTFSGARLITKIRSSSGAIEEGLRRFKSQAVHVASAVGMDLAASDRHGSTIDIDAPTLPNGATA